MNELGHHVCVALKVYSLRFRFLSVGIFIYERRMVHLYISYTDCSYIYIFIDRIVIAPHPSHRSM